MSGLLFPEAPGAIVFFFFGMIKNEDPFVAEEWIVHHPRQQA
jgi:hypothetical protein